MIFAMHNLIIFISIFIIASCSSTPSKKGEGKAQPSNEKIWIVKPDGSLSCGERAGQSPQEAAQGLEKAGAKIFQSRAAHDGKMHMMVCGAETGATIELLIHSKDLSLAEEQGYKLKESK